MRAIYVQQFGGPEVLVAQEVPDPVAGLGQVVVGLAAADVIYLDTLLRSGWGGQTFPVQPPYVPGGGGAGAVLCVGEGVDPGWVGRRVVVRKFGGGYAERVAAEAGAVVEIPEAVGDLDAAAAIHDGSTAVRLAQLGEIQPGEWVLVTAAAGGAGTWVVQLARSTGARVVAAARGEGKLDLARKLGAEVTVDYSQEGWTGRVVAATGGAGVDLAFDGAGGTLGTAALQTVAVGGRFVTYGTAGGRFTEIDPELAQRRRVSVRNALADGPIDPGTARELVTEALALVAQGRIRPAIGATYPLDEAREAHASLARRATVGKSLLTI